MDISNVKTYRDLIEGLKTDLDRQGFPSDDTRWSPRRIMDRLLDFRTTILKRNKVMRQGIGLQNFQTIDCISLDKVDKDITPGNPPSGYTWMKSEKPLPRLILTSFVGNGMANFKTDPIEWGKYRYKINSRSSTTADTQYHTFLDTGEGSYLYILNDKYLDSVTLTGVFENPNSAAIYDSCGTVNEFLKCNPLDTPIYMSRDIADVVVQLALKELSGTTAASTVDVHSDSLENAGGVVFKNS